MSTDLALVGATAPDLSEPAAVASARPRVLAFVRNWLVAGEQREDFAAIRARLRELGAELTVLTARGAWTFRPGERGVFSDRITGDAVTAGVLYSIRDRDAVVVLDGRNVIHFAHQAERGLAASMTDVLAAACDALRERPCNRERVLFTRREWALACLVVGCSLALRGTRPGAASRAAPHAAAAPHPIDARVQTLEQLGARVERRRFARGTRPVLPATAIAPGALRGSLDLAPGAVVTCTSVSSRGATTPCATTGARMSPIQSAAGGASSEIPRTRSSAT